MKISDLVFLIAIISGLVLGIGVSLDKLLDHVFDDTQEWGQLKKSVEK